jgi:hypothetical protein
VSVEPSSVLHADWSAQARGRWAAVAVRRGREWDVSGPRPARGDDLVHGLPRPVLVGIDTPFGLPRRYAAAAGVGSFLDFLSVLGEGRWARVGEVCETLDEVSLERPFFPQRSAARGDRARHLARLGLDPVTTLRRCDAVARAGPLFWTLGPRQVGKGALACWRRLPVGDGARVAIWPFHDPSLAALLRYYDVVLAETYPALAKRRWGRDADSLRRLAEGLAVGIGADLAQALGADFERHGGGDGRDAVAGLLGMLHALRHGPVDPPSDEDVLDVEGWMLGLPPS